MNERKGRESKKAEKWIASVIFFLLFSSLFFASDVSFTIIGKLPVTSLKAPKNLYNLENIPIDPWPKKNFDLFPYLSKPEMVTREIVSPQDFLGLLHKRYQQITIKEDILVVFLPERPVLMEIVGIPEPKITRKPFEETQNSFLLLPRDMRRPTQVETLKPIDFSPPKRGMPEISIGAIQVIPKPVEPLNLLAGISLPKVKNQIRERISLSFSVNSLLDYALEVDSDFLSFQKDFGSNYQVGIAMADSTFLAQVWSGNGLTEANDNARFSVESQNTFFRTHLVDDQFGIDLIRRGWPFRDTDTGLHLLFPYPLPAIIWYPGAEKKFSIGVGVDNDNSYGAVFKIYFEPIGLGVFSGVRFPDLQFDSNVQLSFFVPFLKINLWGSLGYSGNFYGKIRLETQTFSLNPFFISGKFEAGYEGDVFGRAEIEWTTRFLFGGVGATYTQSGFLYDVSVGVRF